MGTGREGVEQRGRREGKRNGKIWISEVTTAEATAAKIYVAYNEKTIAASRQAIQRAVRYF